MSNEISKEDMDTAWELIKPTLYPGIDNPTDINDISRITKDRHGHLKLKRSKKENKLINIGNKVYKDNVCAEVIDIDDDKICVCLLDGNIDVWSISDVRRVGK